MISSEHVNEELMVRGRESMGEEGLCSAAISQEYRRMTKYGSRYLYNIGIGMVPSIIDVWGYDREFCSSSSSSSSP